MTVAANTNPINSTIANGVSTVFAYGFQVLDDEDITVAVDGVVQSIGFTVTGVGMAGGTVVFTTAPANGALVVLYLNPVLERETDYQQFGDWLADEVNRDFDRLWLAIQGANKRIDASMHVSLSDYENGLNTELPEPQGGTALGWAADGLALINIALDTGTSLVDLSASTGAALIGYKQAGTNTKVRSQQNKDEDITDLAEFTGVDLTGANDTSTAFQNAVNNCAARGVTLFCKGKAKIATQINVLNRVNIIGTPNDFTILLATQNMNGIVYGDGTLATRPNVTNSTLQYVDFNPAPGVAQFTSGACVFKNYVGFVHTRNCTFYGLDGGVRKLFNGIVDSKAQDCENEFCRFYEIHGSARITSGAATVAERTVNGVDNFMKVQGIDGDGIHYSSNSAGMSMTVPLMTLVNGWCIKVDPSNSGFGINFFFTQIDFEVDSTSAGGIYHKTGQIVQVCGGWVGYGFGAANFIGVQQDSTADSLDINDLDIVGLRVIISGPASSIDGGQITGDNATCTTALTVNATATDFSIDGCRIRQWTANGIEFVGNPIRCRVNGISFRTIGNENITGQSFAAANLPPQITGCTTDHSPTYTAAATLHLYNGRESITVTGATNISGMTMLGANVFLSVVAGTGGIDWDNSGTLIMRSASPVNQPQFTLKQFWCEGTVWFEV